jgi:multiple sugar transport system permease protein
VHKSRSTVVKVIAYPMLAVWALISVFPYYFTVTTSLKQKAQMYTPTVWSFTPTLENYQNLFNTNDFMHYLTNSLVVVVGTVIPSLFLAINCAYGLVRCQVRGERSVALTLLSLRMVPAIAVVIPYFLLAQGLHLIDTPWLLMIIYMSFNLPLAVWLLRGFFRDIPTEIDEAALVDGASRTRILWQIIVPISMPAIFMTSILLLIQSWNEFVFAQFLTSTQAQTFPTTVSLFISVAGTNFGSMAASVVVGTAPVLIFAFLTQKPLTRGLSYGTV